MFFPEIETPQNTKILVVDDDPAIRESLKAILSSDGYQVYTSKNGKEALEKLFEINPDIMLVDFLMPELDGISLCKIVKNNPETVDIGFILITAVNDLNTRIKGLSAGADDFLNKPFFIPELKARINSISKIKKYRDFLKNYQKVLEKEVEKKTSGFMGLKNFMFQIMRKKSFRNWQKRSKVLRLTQLLSILIIQQKDMLFPML